MVAGGGLGYLGRAGRSSRFERGLSSTEAGSPTESKEPARDSALQLAFVGGVPGQLVTAQVWANLVDIRSYSGGPTLGMVSCSFPPVMPYMWALPKPK